MTPELLERPLSLAFSLIADLALAMNAHPLNKHPGCWTHAVDAHWWIAVNGHSEPKPVVSSAGCTPTVEPFECYVEFNGWPAGVLNPFDGILVAGKCANEDAFCAALTAAIALAAESDHA